MKQNAARKRKMMNKDNLSPKENGNNIYIDEKPIFNIQKIDRVAFVVVGLMFLFFNIIYWLTLTIFNLN